MCVRVITCVGYDFIAYVMLCMDGLLWWGVVGLRFGGCNLCVWLFWLCFSVGVNYEEFCLCGLTH